MSDISDTIIVKREVDSGVDQPNKKPRNQNTTIPTMPIVSKIPNILATKDNRPYSEPVHLVKIRMHTSRPDYNGLDISKLNGQPHAVTGIIQDPSQKAILPTQNDLIECSTTTLLKPHPNTSTKDQPVITIQAGQLIYTIKHNISTSDVEKYIIPKATWDGKTEITTLNRMEKLTRNLQYVAFQFFAKTVKTIRMHYNGHEFDYAPPTHRFRIWFRIFGDAPLQCTKGMLGSCAGNVDLENIFCSPNDDAVRKQWRIMFRIMFAVACEEVAVLCPGEANQIHQTDVRKWYASWKAMTSEENWKDVGGELWCLEKLPVRIGAVVKEDKAVKSLGHHLEVMRGIDVDI